MSTPIVEDAKRRIKEVRQRDVELIVLRDGRPVENAFVSLRMKNHQLLFGAVSCSHGKLGHPGREERFTESFTKLLNYTMVPFHWSWYEPKRGEFNEPHTGGAGPLGGGERPQKEAPRPHLARVLSRLAHGRRRGAGIHTPHRHADGPVRRPVRQPRLPVGEAEGAD